MAECQYLTIAAISEILDVSRWTVGRLIDAGAFPAEVHGGSIRVAVQDFEEYRAKKREAAVQAAESRRQAKAVSVVRPVGRPRKGAVKADIAPKRPVGRPRKEALSASADGSR